MCTLPSHISFFFFNDTATTEIYTLSLHDALPICAAAIERRQPAQARRCRAREITVDDEHRSEEHTSELQSQSNLVCRLLLEKKKNKSVCAVSSTANSQRAPVSPGSMLSACPYAVA